MMMMMIIRNHDDVFQVIDNNYELDDYSGHHETDKNTNHIMADNNNGSNDK